MKYRMLARHHQDDHDYILRSEILNETFIYDSTVTGWGVDQKE